MPFVESEFEFCERHGNDRIRIEEGVWAFSDGAQIRESLMSMEFFEPPSDPRALLEVRRKYHRAKLDIAENSFHALRAALLGVGNGFHWRPDLFGPDPGGDGLPALHLLRDRAAQHRRDLAGVMEEIEQLPGVRAARERERYLQHLDDERRRRQQEFEHRVGEVTLDDHEDVSAAFAETQTAETQAPERSIP